MHVCATTAIWIHLLSVLPDILLCSCSQRVSIQYGLWCHCPVRKRANGQNCELCVLQEIAQCLRLHLKTLDWESLLIFFCVKCLKRLILISHHFTQVTLGMSWKRCEAQKWHHFISFHGSAFLYHMHVGGIFPAGNAPARQQQNLLPMHPHISRSALWSQTSGPSLIKYAVSFSVAVLYASFLCNFF